MEIERVIVKPHWCRKLRQKDGRDQESRYKQRYLKKIKNNMDRMCLCCDKIAFWFVVKLDSTTNSTSSRTLCDSCMNTQYDRCRSHQIIKIKHSNGDIEIKHQYCTVVYPKQNFIIM